MTKETDIFEFSYHLQRFDMNKWLTVTQSPRRKEIESALDMFSAARPNAKYRIRQERKFKDPDTNKEIMTKGMHELHNRRKTRKERAKAGEEFPL